MYHKKGGANGITLRKASDIVSFLSKIPQSSILLSNKDTFFKLFFIKVLFTIMSVSFIKSKRVD